MFVYSRNGFTHSKVKKCFSKEIHIESVYRDNGADEYCLKEETRVDGPWEFGVKPKR